MSYSGPRTRGVSKRLPTRVDNNNNETTREEGPPRSNGNLVALHARSQSFDRSNEFNMMQINALVEQLRAAARGYKEQLDATTSAYCILFTKHSALENRCRDLESRDRLHNVEAEWSKQDAVAHDRVRPATSSGGGIDVLLKASQMLETKGQSREMQVQHAAQENDPGATALKDEEASVQTAEDGIEALQESNQSLERSNQSKEVRIRTLEEDLRSLERVSQMKEVQILELKERQMEELEKATATRDDLSARNSTLKEKCKKLEREARREGKEREEMKNMLAARNSTLQEKCKKLESAARLKNEKFKELLAKETEFRLKSEGQKELVAKHSALKDKCKKMESDAKLKNERFKELVVKHSALENRCKKLESAAKLKDAELQTLKMDADALKETSRVLERMKGVLEAKVQSQEKRHEEELDSSKASHNELAEKHAVAGERIKELETAAQGLARLRNESEQAKEKQIRALRVELKETLRVSKEKADSSRAAQEVMMAERSALEDKCQKLEGAARRKDEELRSLRKERKELEDLSKAEYDRLASKYSALDQLKNKEARSLTKECLEKEARLTKELEEAAGRHKEELASSKAKYDELASRHSALEGEYKKSESAARLKEEKLQELVEKNSALTDSIGALQEASMALERIVHSKEAQILKLKEETEEAARLHKEELESSKTTNNELASKHSALEDKFGDLMKEAELNIKEIKTLRKDAIAAKESVESLRATSRSLEWSNQAKEKQICSSKEENAELEEALGRQKEELESSKAAYQEMAAKHSDLEAKRKNLQSEVELKNQEVRTLKRDADAAKESIESLRERNRSLEKSNQAKEKQAGSLEQQLEDKCKNLLSAARLKDQELQSLKEDAVTAKKSIKSLQERSGSFERSNGVKEERIRALEEELKTAGGSDPVKPKEELAETARKHEEELESSKASYEGLALKCSALKHMGDEAELKNQEVQSLKKDAAAAKELAARNAALEDKCKNLESDARLESKELWSLKKDDDTAKETIGMLQGTSRSLKLYNETKEKQIRSLNEELETARVRKEQLESSKASYDELVTKHSALEERCKSLEGASKLKEEQLDSSVTLDPSKASYHELVMKHLALEDKCKSLESAAKLKEELEEAVRGYKEQLDSSKTAYQELAAKNSILKDRWRNLRERLESSKAPKHSALENECKVLEIATKLERDAPKLKIEHEASLALKRGYEQQLETLEESLKEAKETVELHARDVASKEEEIKQLIIDKKDLCNQMDDLKKSNEGLQSEVNKLLLQVSTQGVGKSIVDLGAGTNLKQANGENGNIPNLREVESNAKKSAEDNLLPTSSSAPPIDAVAAAPATIAKPNLGVLPGATASAKATGANAENKSPNDSPHEDGQSESQCEHFVARTARALRATKGSGRGGRKRKATDTPHERPSARKPSTPRAGEAGDVGYRFRRFYDGSNRWKDGEVIEILGNNFRKCQYDDGSIETYRLGDIKQNCRPR